MPRAPDTPLVAKVLLAAPLPEAFDYLVPVGLDLAVGDLVAAPLGPRTAMGVLVEIRPNPGLNRALKLVAHKLDAPPLPAATLAFLDWAARYSVDAPGVPLAIALRGLRAPRPRPPPPLLVAAPGRPPSLTALRSRVLDAALGPVSRAELVRITGVSSGLVKSLIDRGALVAASAPVAATGDLSLAPRALNPSQAEAARQVGELVAAGRFAATLLDGVTGSGKTEVYLEAAASALARDPEAQVLVLLPEIALTEAVIDRFGQRFGVRPHEWHSGVSPPRRREVWEDAIAGRARIVVGARSALFLPFRRLGLIVVDEEHDGGYKQEDGFIYQARDFAVARAKIEDCPVVLASATPSLETLWNARAGRYRWIRLAARHGEAVLPRLELVDLREEPPAAGGWLSPPLVQAMADTLARGEQTLLFLNRRGYAPLVLCRACGERMKAPDSDSWLVEHRYSGRLVCHLTGFSMPRPDRCPACAAPDSLVAIGPGVERVEEEARRLFPDARIAVFSSDHVRDAAAARALIAS
ncbi:MAG: primosomal protein N', partial [Caulobacteraceae bacterium]|nr:primosomal protein N' [Caulobacteraceae bacterium]